MIKSETAPAGLAQSARAAVDLLGTEVVAGRYKFSIDRMYLPWKERLAKREGGMARVDAKLLAPLQELQRSGITILSSKAVGEITVFEGGLGTRVEKTGGRDVASFGYTKWLAFVPTVTRLKLFKDGQTLQFEKTTFQIAITDKGKNDWSFIDGSTISLVELRALFPTLPADLKLPPVNTREVKGEAQR